MTVYLDWLRPVARRHRSLAERVWPLKLVRGPSTNNSYSCYTYNGQPQAWYTMETDRSEGWLSRLTELIRARLFTSHSIQIHTPSPPRSARVDSLDLERQPSEHSLSKDEKDNQNQPSSPSESAHLGPLNVTVRPGPATLGVSNNNNQSETNSERNGVEEHLPSVLPAPPPTTPSSARTEPHAPVDDLPDNQAILPPSTANPSGITPPTLPASLIDPELAPTTRLPGPPSQFSGFSFFNI